MEVLLLTVFLSLALALLFLIFFMKSKLHSNPQGMEQESLRPFKDETPSKEKTR